MKTGTLLVLILSSRLGMAAASVKITSFLYAGNQTRAAEICGRVSDQAVPLSGVHAIVDPTSGNAGHYYTLVGKDGLFCIAVMSQTGLADAQPWIPGSREESTPVRIYAVR